MPYARATRESKHTHSSIKAMSSEPTSHTGFISSSGVCMCVVKKKKESVVVGSLFLYTVSLVLTTLIELLSLLSAKAGCSVGRALFGTHSHENLTPRARLQFPSSGGGGGGHALFCCVCV